jgi:hypothetical protein
MKSSVYVSRVLSGPSLSPNLNSRCDTKRDSGVNGLVHWLMNRTAFQPDSQGEFHAKATRF